MSRCPANDEVVICTDLNYLADLRGGIKKLFFFTFSEKRGGCVCVCANLTKMENFGIDLCPLQGSFFSQFGAENSKRHGVYLQKKGPPPAIYNFNLYGQNARFSGFSTFSETLV